MHPADEIRGVKSRRLAKKRIVLGITGSIAAIESVKLSRELIRHGAEVFPVMTHSATKIIHPDSLEFATGNKPVIELTGKTEHVYFCGRVKEPADLLIISPCTANTISKIAHGIDDTPVTTFATTAIGSGMPMLIVPAMHLSMYDHKVVQKNVLRCKEVGVVFVEPLIQENKAKMANIDEIIAYVIRDTDKRGMADKRVLIIGGSSAEAIDDVRIISNCSSGKTAVSLAKSFFYRSADVELWYGCSKEPVPSYIKILNFKTVGDIIELMKTRDIKNFDVIIICAALSDYIPEKIDGKISSNEKKLILEMSPAPKIVAMLREKAPTSKLIGFKLEENSDKLHDKAYSLLKNNNLDFVIANRISGLNDDKNEVWIIDKKGDIKHKTGKKEQLADWISYVVI